jgi:carbamoyltransferase
MMKDQLIISAYGSHNAAVAMYYKGNYQVIEVERWLSKKNAGLLNYLPAAYPKIIFDEISDFLLSQTDRSDVDLYLTNYNDLNKLKPAFAYGEHKNFDHHSAHAATSFYQSPYDSAITFTFDGGGDLGFFNVYKTDRRNGVQLLERFNQDLGFAYMILADHLDDITRDPLNIGNLVYAGKLMGLCSYGKIRDEWVPHFTEFYETFNYRGDSYLGGAEAAVDAIPRLMEKLGVENFNNKTRFKGQFAWDIAATTQFVFEEQFFKFARPYMEKYPDMPITLSGGCALNVILNARLLNEHGKVFVPPNTSDCGVAVGGLLLQLKPEYQVDLTYSGAPILDEHMFSSYIENGNFSVVENVSIKELAHYINRGNIVGVINGNSEHGPRALGNRSILCNPIGDMKDVLNAKVKNREWYRPFAPLVRLEDASKYFHFPEGAQSRHMTYVAEVRDEYKAMMPAITHEDGTGRIQTVTEQQNKFIYDLITEFDAIGDHGVLLNTSFNVNGKPILTRISEALEILSKTQMDAVYFKERLIFRKGGEKLYEQHAISENIKPLDNATTLYLMATPEDVSEISSKYIPKMESIISSKKDNVVIVTQTSNMEMFKSTFGDKAKYLALPDNWVYYHEMLEDSVPNVDTTIHGVSKIMRMLWAKSLMYENLFRTKNHMFVTVDAFLDSDSIVNDVKLITGLAKDSSEIIVKGKTYDGVLTQSELKKMSGVDGIPEEVPTLDIVWGSFDQIEWLSVNVEAYLLTMLRGGIDSSDDDYVMIPFVQHPYRFGVY